MNTLFNMAYRGLIDDIASKEAVLKESKDLLDKLLAECPHETLEDRSYYFQGSYTDTAYTEKWSECVCCKKKFNFRTFETNRYS